MLLFQRDRVTLNHVWCVIKPAKLVDTFLVERVLTVYVYQDALKAWDVGVGTIAAPREHVITMSRIFIPFGTLMVETVLTTMEAHAIALSLSNIIQTLTEVAF